MTFITIMDDLGHFLAEVDSEATSFCFPVINPPYHEIKGIHGLGDLPQLQQLDFSHHRIRDFKAPEGCENRTALNLSFNKLREIPDAIKIF